MTHWYVLLAEAEYKQQTFLKEAEAKHGSQPANPLPAGKNSVICVVLDKVGQRLVELGTLLRTRYGVSPQ